jgi:hypothetical protein
MRVDQPYGKRYAEDSFQEEPKKRYFIRAEGLIPRPLGRMKGIKSRLRYL